MTENDRLDNHIQAYTVAIEDIHKQLGNHSDAIARQDRILFGDPTRGIEGIVQRGYRLDYTLQHLQSMIGLVLAIGSLTLLAVVVLIVIIR